MFTVSDAVRHYGQDHPEAIALIFEDRRTRFADLDTRADRVAAAILAAGVPKGGRIAYLGKNSDVFFEIVLGAMRSGTCLVPINWRLAPPEMDYIARDSDVSLLFAGEDFLDRAGALAARVICIEGARGAIQGYADWRDAGGDGTALPPIDPEASFLQFYTSGTTGHPKGVITTNARYAAHLARFATLDKPWIRGTGIGDVILVPMPNYHLSGGGTGLEALFFGSTVVVQREFSPAGWLDAIAQYKVNRAFLVPAALRLVLDDPRLPGLDVSSLNYVSYGASPIQPEVLSQALELLGCQFVHLYGMTECMASITALDPHEHTLDFGPRMKSVGLPLPEMEIRIVDADGKEQPVGETGEIQLRAPFTMVGYWNRPDASAEAYAEDGWMRTGDAGYKDADGYLYIRDRVRDMIISGGENVYPVEVENAVTSHPAVEEAAVIGIPDARWGEAVAAIVVPRAGETIDADALIAWTRERIARYKCPRSVHVVEELPRNASGKVLRRTLREAFWTADQR
ncbi:MAG: long-chain-fatty-acid--CoA ligase [Sphingobium sp.]